MVVRRIASRITKTVVAHCRNPLLLGRQNGQTFRLLANQCRHQHSLSPNKVVTSHAYLLHNSLVNSSAFQRFVFSSSASPQPDEKETVESQNGQGTTVESNDTKTNASAGDQNAAEDSMEADLSMDDLVKLVAEKEEELKTKHKEIENMRDKMLRACAEAENLMERTKREAENSKKFAIQSFAKSLLDVADNLGRASSVVKESFTKLDTSVDTAGAVPLLKTLLEGVEMTEKQLAEVFRKYGVERYDPTNEQFDPHRHNAVFQVPDAAKSPGTVAVVLKAGYMLHDRIIRPAEVGVTIALDQDK